MKIAGIGSRKTPANVLHTMRDIGRWCSSNQVIVRSGHAEGADMAFESAGRYLEVYLPWKTFNAEYPLPLGAWSKVWSYNPEKDDPWLTLHPQYPRLKDSVRALMGRNAMQVLGPNYNDPVNAVVCWTEGGKDVGGTAHAIRIARKLGIPVLNLGSPDTGPTEVGMALSMLLMEHRERNP